MRFLCSSDQIVPGSRSRGEVVNVRQGQYLIADAWAGVGLLYGLASVL